MTSHRTNNPKGEEVKIKPLMNPWQPTTDKKDLKILGKAVEELGESTSAIARCIIQQITESEPVTGKPNKRWLEEEVADVYASLEHVVQRFDLDIHFIVERTNKKFDQLGEWHNMI